MGVAVESNDYTFRIDDLRCVLSRIRFLSLEPLLSSFFYINLTNIDWVIVGGESGSRSRPVKKEWIVDIQKKCYLQKNPFFFKQWGGVNKKNNGRLLNGKTYSEIPVINDFYLIRL